MTPPTTQEAGLKLVPAEPTGAMEIAGARLHDSYRGTGTVGALNAQRNVKDIYRAMVSAASSPEPMQVDLREAGEIVRRWANWIIDESADMEADDHDAGKRKVRAERDLILAAMQAKSAPVAWGRTVNLGFDTDEPTLRDMVEHYYRSHSMPDPMLWTARFVKAQDEAHPSPSAPNPDLAGLVERISEWLSMIAEEGATDDGLDLTREAAESLGRDLSIIIEMITPYYVKE